jgi:hypothetical protein
MSKMMVQWFQKSNVQDFEELSRSPKRKKTKVGNCQKVCQDGVKLQGTTVVTFWVSNFVPVVMENTYVDLQATLDKEGIRLIMMRQGLSSGRNFFFQ